MTGFDMKCPHGVDLKASVYCAQCADELAKTMAWDEHPAGYDGPCLCRDCATADGHTETVSDGAA